MLTVRRLTTSDMSAVTAIVAGLPDYFTSDVPGRVEQDAAARGGWVLADGDEVTAFAVTARADCVAWREATPCRRYRGHERRMSLALTTGRLGWSAALDGLQSVAVR
jgi:hypothetical protein